LSEQRWQCILIVFSGAGVIECMLQRGAAQRIRVAPENLKGSPFKRDGDWI
jgi:hypothetical protein